MTSSAADMPRRRFEYRVFFQKAQAAAIQGGIDFNEIVHRHSVKIGRTHNIDKFTARDLRHWPKWIKRALMKMGVRV